ncbi:MAG: DUF924 family protein [Pseudomonadales bacterium]
MQIPDKCLDILHFWFGQDFTHGMPAKKRSNLWFGASAETDSLITTRFEVDLQAAAAGAYNDWCELPEGRLALIILLDQFPRNIYRGTAQAFAYDEQACQLCMEGLKQGHDQKLMPAYRTFYYMPLEHSESLQLQQHCVELFNRFYQQSDPAIRETLRNSLEFAQQHLDIIEKFARFPHRNTLLGRESTAQELAYLEESGVNFGQESNEESRK